MLNEVNLNTCILITTYNGARTIAKTITGIIENIRELQIKLFVFDDCSTDNTIEVIKNCWCLNNESLIIKKNEKNLGLFENKNQALRFLSQDYDWVFLMHQDDSPYKIWLTEHLRVITQYADDKTFVIWSSYKTFDYNSNTTQSEGDHTGIIKKEVPSKENFIFYIVNIYTPYCISGSVINCRLLNEIGFFDRRYKHFGDTDFLVKGLIKGFNHIYIALPLIVRTLSDFQASSKNKVAFNDIKEMSFFYNSYSKHLPRKERLKFGRYLLYLSSRRFFKSLYKFNIKGIITLSGYSTRLFISILKNVFTH